LEALKSSGLI